MYKKALIPAAGRGARLDRPNTPKPLVDVGGRPIIFHLLKRLEEVGVEHAVIVVGYEGKKIERQLAAHPDFNMKIELVENAEWEKGLASSLLAARGAFAGSDEPFLLAMADHLFDAELVAKMAALEIGDDQIVSMLVDRDTERIYDIDAAVKLALKHDKVVDAGRHIENFQGIDAGLFACKPAVFDALEEVLEGTDGEPVDLTAGLAKLGAAQKVGAAYVDGALWFDIDTPPMMIRAEMAMRKQHRVQTVLRPEFADASDVKTKKYTFTTGKPHETDVYVQRGFVRNPDRLQLIPDASASSPVYVFTDTKVNSIYGDDFVGGLKKMGYDVRRVVMAEGEEAKTLENYTRLVEHVIGEGIDERSILISLGGGAVCNVCGFLASTLYRGIGLVHVPTTLMAQCDAAISHKQGVNGARGKNLVGSYYPPISIAVDVEVLATLEDWLIPDGLSEVVKHALGQDPEYLQYLLDYDGSIHDPDFLETVVRKNIELKCELMAVDPKEYREGMVLQYGHTVGHPIEFLSAYDLNHGQSVGIGMMIAARVSRLLGGCGDDIVELHERLIKQYKLPTRIPASIDIDDIMSMMRYNKRYLTEGTRMALVDGPGSLWSVDGDYVIPVSDAVLREAIKQTY
ncbi:NTP transferase domain-containing protein [Bradymonas sediminis]|nr:NTP transferase domain-containing protein [Bradymonas sediminis]TDP75289.1 3-dehydroquinate synthase [Bradymonas sediminis]